MSAKKSSYVFRFFSVLMLLTLLIGAVGVTPAYGGGGHIHYAKPAATGNGDCHTWANACTLQTALANAGIGANIWVMAGTHKPATSYLATATFQLKDGVAVYGGFIGTETARDQRDFTTNVTILSGSFTTNKSAAPDDANGFSNYVYHVVTGATGATLDGFTITGGHANGAYPDNRGGGLYNDSSSPTLTNIIFSNNSAVYGGGLYNFASNPTLLNVTFSDNSATIYGGGMANNESSPLLMNLTFNGNSAVEEGGGMYSRGESIPILTTAIFTANTAAYGGGMFNQNSHPALTEVTFSGNSVTQNGAGMYNANVSHPTLTQVTFSQNSAAVYGGGMANSNASNPFLTNVSFLGNTATAAGGGIYNNASSPTLTRVSFGGNSAGGGGGMHNENNSSPTLTDVLFASNTANTGGGMNNRDSNPMLTNLTFSENSAVNYGGGIYNTLGSHPILINVTFNHNSATNGGGGGIYNNASNPALTNVTFHGNSAAGGGGMYNYSTSNFEIRNTIFWGNTATTVGPQLHNNASDPIITNSVVQNGCPAGSACHNLVTTDPRLGVFANHGGYTDTIPLLADSSAINTGNNAICPATDQRGVARPQGAGCDIGAYEYYVPAAFTKSAPANGATGRPLSPTLSWNTSDGATSYEYCYSSASGPCTQWHSVGANTSVTLNGLAPNYTYYWQVRAVSVGGTTEANGSAWWSFTTIAAPACTWPAYTEPATATFGDVPMDVGHWSWVERLANSTITAGCGADNYCPLSEVNRAQMAIFLLRGKHCGSSYTPPAVGASTGFGDVPLDATYAPWVKQLAAEGVTAGCGGGNFCPQTVVNRAQIAIFLLRAMHGSTYSPPAVGASSGFADVPTSATYAPWVKQLAAEGITAGCGGSNFCPLQNVNRAQMATFLVRAFGLP